MSEPCALIGILDDGWSGLSAQAHARLAAADLIVGAMIGKLTKIAQGLSVTHAWREEVDRELIASAAAEVGAPPDLVAEIRAAETARFAAERLAELDLAVAFHRALAERAIRSLRQRYPGPYRLTVLACNFEGVPIVTVEEHELV